MILLSNDFRRSQLLFIFVFVCFLVFVLYYVRFVHFNVFDERGLPAYLKCYCSREQSGLHSGLRQRINAASFAIFFSWICMDYISANNTLQKEKIWGSVPNCVSFSFVGEFFDCLLYQQMDPIESGPEYVSASSLLGLLPCRLPPHCLLAGNNRFGSPTERRSRHVPANSTLIVPGRVGEHSHYRNF